MPTAQVQQDAAGWRSFACSGATNRWRPSPDGRHEIEGEGFATRAWPAAVSTWRTEVIAASLKHGVPAAWIAAVIALESGGKSESCVRAADGSCDSRDGYGLMALLTSTAAIQAGRPVSGAELMADPALNIDLGTKLLRENLDKYGGDFVATAVAYNAGSPRCGAGNVWPTRDEPCPPTGWGVVLGCVYAARSYGSRCAPSTLSSGRWVCSNDYPRAAIELANAAYDNGFSGIGGALVATVEEHPAAFGLAGATLLLGGAAAGFLLMRKVAQRV